MGAIDDALNGLDGNEAALQELTDIRATSEASVAQITDLTTKNTELTTANTELSSNAGLEALQTSVSAKDAQIALLNGEIETHTSKATEFEALTLKNTELVGKVTELTNKQSDDLKTRLKAYGIEDAQTADKDLATLAAMESAAIAVRGTAPPPPTHGHGMDGTGDGPPSEPKTALEAATAQLVVIKTNPDLNGATNTPIE